eukprot:TRINITY_DN35672_c0_g1_i1.p1 TRINITY_DN35672_c0_g1~~TRINITY_DN35672_c0_g1_i1.p1  ORF type:complete len:209 (+),score=40.74 TRINITY_DN35672_c0_g1_i1:320-946(+)
MNTIAGTFVKVTNCLEVQVGMVFEIGSHFFQILDCQQTDKFKLFIEIFDDFSYTKKMNFTLDNDGSSIGIGRLNSNEICFTNDKQLSQNHSRFIKQNSRLFIEDVGSTNGTWYCIGRSEQKYAETYKITDNVIIKLGQACQIKAMLKQNEKAQSNEQQQLCCICLEQPKNAVLMPCRHNAICMECANKVKLCPMCQEKIVEIVKIYLT